jgi:dienelactone hydrolase
MQFSGRTESERVQYRDGNTLLNGYLSWSADIAEVRPGVLVIHDWQGLSEYVMMRADQLAGLGYIAFAADVYGGGKVCTSNQEASAETVKYYRDRQLYRGRVRAAFDCLSSRHEVDPSRIAVIGYCFGGAGALELARSGASVRGVVTFHGGLSTPKPADAKNIKAKILVLHGADDPFVKQDDVRAFMDEMKSAGVDYQIVQYGGAVHGFTKKSLGTDSSKGSAYNESADRRSWQAMRGFFEEIFSA